MSTDPTHPPPFYCPACGQKHRADLSAIEGGAGRQAHVTCARCEVVMNIFFGEDGLPKCEVRNEASPLEQAAAPKATPTSDLSSHLPSHGGTTMKSSLPLQLVAAALVAAVISLAVGMLARSGNGKESGASDDARFAALEGKIHALETQLSASRADAEKQMTKVAELERSLRAAADSNSTALNDQDGRLRKLETERAAVKDPAATIEALHKQFDGRIEQNYQLARKLEKRVKSLEGQ